MKPLLPTAVLGIAAASLGLSVAFALPRYAQDERDFVQRT
jgi:hypothetical protein